MCSKIKIAKMIQGGDNEDNNKENAATSTSADVKNEIVSESAQLTSENDEDKTMEENTASVVSVLDKSTNFEIENQNQKMVSGNVQMTFESNSKCICYFVCL